MAESLPRMQDFLKSHQYPFPVLSDVRREVVKAYGVYVRMNFESINISRPAECVLDREGIVKYMYIGRIQTDFPEDEEILSVLDALKS